MADLSHVFGNDLTLSATGDLAIADGTDLGTQRVLKRLMTAPRAYIWQLAYGAGLPRFIGTPANKERIAAVTRAQMYREAVVARTPAPLVTVDVQPTGVVTLGIKYTDSTTQAPAVLNFNVNG